LLQASTISRASGAAPHSGGLAVQSLSHAFGDRRVVDNVSFVIAPGEVHCLMGPSGCGKSTTLRLIAGLLRLQSGRITLNDTILSDPRTHHPCESRRIGLMFQDLALFPHLDIVANVAFGLRGLRQSARIERAMGLLESVGMGMHAHRFPGDLSGGEQQRVALARALAPEPQLMLLDEPFSALDSALRADVRNETLSRLRESRVPSLLVTHDPDEAITAGDVVHAMRDGRLVQSGSPDELYRRPASEQVAQWFGQVMTFKGQARAGMVRTPLADIATEAPDGTAVDVAIRAEAIRFKPNFDGAGAAGRIIDCRRMGPSCSIAIKLEQGPLLTLRVPSATPHQIGMRIGFDVDPKLTFVFERPAPPAA